jgi:hypothetical protein
LIEIENKVVAFKAEQVIVERDKLEEKIRLENEANARQNAE